MKVVVVVVVAAAAAAALDRMTRLPHGCAGRGRLSTPSWASLSVYSDRQESTSPTTTDLMDPTMVQLRLAALVVVAAVVVAVAPRKAL